jgi:hypothetical protein
MPHKTKTELMTRRLHPALWAMIDGRYRMTDLYAELFHLYLTGELDQERFLQRSDEIQAAYDSDQPPF